MDVGVDRVIVGTAALEGEEFVQDLCDRIGSERVVAGVDARNGFVAVRGWTEESGTPVHDLVARMEETGVSRIIYTDISRDGTRTEPNFQQVDELLVATRLKMLVAGGVSRIDHIRRLAKMGVEGAIVGTAAYTGVIDMREAIEEQKSRA